MVNNDALGDRMKMLEKRGASGSVFLPLLPIVGRVDGKAFHSFTKGLERPYDQRLSRLMVNMTKYVVAQTGALLGYTQSDEASFLWFADNYNTQLFHGAKAQKMNSVVASMATAYFNKYLAQALPEKADKIPLFDCRVFQLPVKWEVGNYFLWRELDATRNSIQMAARAYYSHKECNLKNTSDLHEMLFHKNINWDKYPAFFKRGTYVQKRKVKRTFSAKEIEKLPKKHAARRNPNLVIERTEIQELKLPPIGRLANRNEVIFEGADPVLRTEYVNQ